MEIKDMSRREFFIKSSAGVSAVALYGNSYKKETKPQKLTDGEILYRDLGKTGIRMQISSMGVMNADNPAVLKRAYESGIRHYDTAWRYQSGRNERMVGQVIKEMQIRDKIILATKAPLAFGNHASYTIQQIEDLRKTEGSDLYKKLKQDYFDTFEESLERLQQKYVDILYIHSVKDPGTLELDFLQEALLKLKKDGRVRFLGMSTHANEVPVIDKAVDLGIFDVILAPVNFKTTKREAIKASIKRASEKGIGIVAMKTQAIYSTSRETHHTAALKYVMQNDYITTAIPGFTTFDQLDEDFSVARNLKMTEDEESYLKNFWNQSMKLEIPCQQCEKCLKTCPRNADIPELMRTYMYAAGYKNFEHSRITYDGIPGDKNLSNCTDCENCTGKCINGLNIASNIRHLKALFC